MLLAIFLIFPIVVLAGCDTKEEIIEINNVERIWRVNATGNSYITPYQNKVWYNTKTQRIYYYDEPRYTEVFVNESSVLKHKKYDLPFNEYYLEFEYEPA